MFKCVCSRLFCVLGSARRAAKCFLLYSNALRIAQIQALQVRSERSAYSAVPDGEARRASDVPVVHAESSRASDRASARSHVTASSLSGPLERSRGGGAIALPQRVS